MTRFDEVAGYTYWAANYCPNCTIEGMKADGWANPYDTADDISQLADNQGFDFDNLHTFDSDTFPKPFLGDMLDCGNTDMGATEHEKCDSCRTNLCGGE